MASGQRTAGPDSGESHGGRENASNGLLGLFDPPPARNREESTAAAVRPGGGDQVDPESLTESRSEATPQSAATETSTSKLTGLFAPPEQEVQGERKVDFLDPVSEHHGETTTLLSPAQDFYDATERRTNASEAFLEAKALSHVPLTSSSLEQTPSRFKRFVRTQLQATTFAGAIMFLLYHVVFCLANGSAIIRPNSPDKPILGVMAKMSTVGILFAGPFYILRLGQDIPALYPSIDLFLAPFLAEAAALLDQSLTDQYGGSYPDSLFFGTFAMLASIGMFFAGAFLVLAASVKLANLGTYLPYSVLCGFFSAVGVLLWALAFSVDTSGKTWKVVFFSGDSELIWNSLLHHFPSLVVGILMNRLGPKNPFFVILLIIVTQISFYGVMWATGRTLEDAQEAKWFWSLDELVYHAEPTAGLESWILPPAPFGSFGAMFAGHVSWTAVMKGLGNMAALAFLYLLRSSIHASAMKKNVGNLVRRIPIDKRKNGQAEGIGDSRPLSTPGIVQSVRKSVHIVKMSLADRQPPRKQPIGGRRVSELLPILSERASTINEAEPEFTEIRADPSRMTLEEIFVEYGYAFFVVALCGGFGNCPTVATSNTMYAIGADKAAPQLGSVFLLLIFYVTDFQFVRFIPKTAFSSLLVLGAVDTLVVWFFGAFRKTQDLTEWLVVPIIVIFSLFVGFLNAVFLGIGISTFVFVAAFFRVGVVKFSATGLEIRSRVERSMAQSIWLDENGDCFQVLVLQGYLFFGNATSILNYISTMFEEVDPSHSERLDFSLPPLPEVLIIDLSLITGMDTSTVDIFSEIKELCSNNECRLFLCGLSPRMRKGLAMGGVKPETGRRRSKGSVRVFADLDTALGKAEDLLIETGMDEAESTHHSNIAKMSGFRSALEQIDDLYGQEFSEGLLALQRYVVPLELESGQMLYQSDGGVVQERHRGLFFIESGQLKIERDSSKSLTLTRTSSGHNLHSSSVGQSLKGQHARIGSIARKSALAKGSLSQRSNTGHFRLARIGPGWVCGMFENASGLKPAGVTIAVTHCRLHHLPFHKLEEIEKEESGLVLQLYKMLSYIMAHREEIAMEKLSMLHTIMSSPAHSKPIPRSALYTIS